MLSAASYFGYQLPEVFAGLPRERDAVPDRLPDRRTPAGLGGRDAGAAAAGAAGPPARPAARPAETRAPEELPSWAGRSLRLTGIRAFDRAWDVRVEHGHVTVDEA